MASVLVMDRIKRKTMSLSFHRKNSANNSERITLTRKSVGD
jgi:hypothetical protein